MTVLFSDADDIEDGCASKALNELISLASGPSEPCVPFTPLTGPLPISPPPSSVSSASSASSICDTPAMTMTPIGLYDRVQNSLKRVIGVFSSDSPLLKKKNEGALTQTTLVQVAKDSPVPSPKLDAHVGGKPFPTYKKLKDLDYAVDAFCYGPIPHVKGYFLSHFHADHYAGLNKKFQYGPIYCSKVTAHLIDIQLKVMHEYIQILPMEQEIELEPGVTVTLLDANHCPGAVMFLFKNEREEGKPKFMLHTGDFRADAQLVASRWLDRFRRGHGHDPHSHAPLSLEVVYLDTTYADPVYQFPCQSAVLAELKTWVHRLAIVENQRKLVPFQYLFVVGAYTVGKEKVALTVAQTLKSRIHVHMPHQRRIYDMYGWREFQSLLELDSQRAQVHIVPMAWLNAEKLSDILSRHGSTATHVIALRPTGWTWTGERGGEESDRLKGLSSTSSAPFKTEKDKKIKLEFACTKLKYHTVDALGTSVSRADRIFLYAVPYSEHSSYEELCQFMKAFHIEHIIPTVPSRHNLALLNEAASQRDAFKQEASE